ncbi:MAG: YcaO-like family protein [Deltaproteobacteria bacterium]|nr:YcaO-like family protein [Deltaproteobacteria bacterium]
MQFQNHIRNKYGKCDLPGKTLQRIRQGFDRLGLQVEYAPFKVSENLYWGRIWIDSIKMICEGKGITPQLAEASAYAELTERLSAGMFYPVFEEQVRFNLPALYGEKTMAFLNFEWMKGYVNAHQDELENPLRIEDLLINETHLSKEDIEDIKGSNMARHWVDGFSITRQKNVKVPVNFMAYIHGSNGMAAGNTIEEAIIQATCEVFERYAQIRIIRPEKEVPTIDKNSVENPFIHEMIRFYEKQEIHVLIKDFSFDGMLPVIGVLYINKNLPPDRLEHKLLIPGASFNLEEGLTRCFTEGAQGRATLKRPRPAFDKPVVHKSDVDDYYMLMRCGVAMKDISFLEKGSTKPYEDRKCKDLYDEINEIKKVCHRLDTDFIILDYTHPVINFPVVRIVIPGMSDFLPFLRKDVLVSEKTKPSSARSGGEFIEVMKSFFADKNSGPFAKRC